MVAPSLFPSALRTRGWSLASFVIFTIAACGSFDPEAQTPPSPEPPPSAQAPQLPPEPPLPAEPPELDPPSALPQRSRSGEAFQIVDLPSLPAPQKAPSVKVSAPRAGESIPADRAASYAVKIDVADWPVAPGGPCVHLVLDGQPYLALYQARAEVRLGDVAPYAKLDEGHHVLAAFPAHESHLSVKDAKGRAPLTVVHFTVGKAQRTAIKPSDPLLVLNRPKGTYNGVLASAVAIDLLVVNAELGRDKYAVKLTVAPPGEAPKTSRVISTTLLGLVGLPNGETTIKAELVTRDDKPVPGALSAASRAVNVNRDAPSEQPLIVQ